VGAPGQTPQLDQSGGQRQKVSVAAALWLPPRRDRLSLSFATLVNGYFDNWQSAAFLEALLQELTGRVVVVWDGGSMHKGDAIHELAERCADRLSLEKFPPYAPILNPVEPVWSWLKYGRLCNFAPQDAIELDQAIVAELTSIQNDQGMLQSFFHASELPLPRALLS
jgi:putative transposase